MDQEVGAMTGPAVTVETAERGGWGQGLDEQFSFQLDTETADILRIMRANSRRPQSEILREALLGQGLRSVPGYLQALAEYKAGRRVAKVAATGGRPAGGKTGGTAKRSSGVSRRAA